MQVEAVAALFIGVRELLAVVAAGVALCSLDDLAIDLFFFGRFAWRALTIYRRHPRATVSRLPDKPHERMALLVPAWNEAAVIGPMLRNLLTTLDYPAFHVFVGAYVNDPATQAVVAQIEDERLSLAINPRAGPSTKADCLNVLWRAALAHEARTGVRFRAIVLHDAEDVVHPRELRIFDHLIARRELIQLPVTPLPDRRSRWIAGTYQDEFAEAHMKDLVVREAIGAAVPSAGVACAIDRDMLARIAALGGGLPFDPNCVTEDYEIGLRLHALGGRGCLVRIRAGDDDPAAVATREYFPTSFDAAVRQKSRRLLGIALQGWDRVGWHGGIANRLMLLRDRKSIAAALLTLLAYISFIAVLCLGAIRAAYPPARAFPPLIEPHHVLGWLVAFNFAMLLWRLAMRAACCWRVYGRVEALRSIPRALLGNVINITAAGRALRLYVSIALGLRKLEWEKTAHRYPTVRAPAS